MMNSVLGGVSLKDANRREVFLWLVNNKKG